MIVIVTVTGLMGGVGVLKMEALKCSVDLADIVLVSKESRQHILLDNHIPTKTFVYQYNTHTYNTHTHTNSKETNCPVHNYIHSIHF